MTISSGVEQLLGEPILVGRQVVVLPFRQPAPPAKRARPGRGGPLVRRQSELQRVQGEVVRLERDRRAQPIAPIGE